jgi:hypothetical protein
MLCRSVLMQTVSAVFPFPPPAVVAHLQQTAVLPCTPRIISDYVGSHAAGPYARSAPNSGGRSLAAAAAAGAAAAGDRAAGQQGDDVGECLYATHLRRCLEGHWYRCSKVSGKLREMC